MVLVEYNSSNSGGGWWLNDDDWKRLEKAGWEVKWGGVYFCHSKWSKLPKGKENVCGDGEKCPGHRKYDTWEQVGDDKWLGCLSKEATKEFESISDALREFEEITGESVTDEGCNCCGAPHTFYWDNKYASGDELSQYIYGDLGKLSKRELMERLKDV